MNTLSSLKWLASNPNAADDIYEWWDEQKKILSVTFNEFSGSAKVESEFARRSFKIEKEGFLRNKTVIKNEYGINIGILDRNFLFDKEGEMHLNDQHFHYSITSNTTEVSIYKKTDKTPFLSCSLSVIRTLATTSLEKFHCLLAALCWSFFLPVKDANFMYA